jgi:hypothetical protein
LLPGVAGDRLSPCGCRELGHAMRQHILMNEAAEPIPSQWPNGRAGARGSAICGWVLVKRSVRVVGVEMVDVLAQHCGEVRWSGDQEAVEAFAPKRADPAFRDRVRSRRSERCADDADVGAGEHRGGRRR